MKKGIHAPSHDVKFICACGETFTARTTKNEDEIHVEICSKCHPFYTGKQGNKTLTGNVEKFNKKYGLKEEK